MDHRLMYVLRRQGKERPGVYYTGGGYETAKQIGNYKVDITNDIEDNKKRIILWSPKFPCVDMMLYVEDKTVSVGGLEYASTCTIDGKMSRGKETRDMFTFALGIAKKEGAKIAELTDLSTVLCNGKRIELAPLYFLKFGMTWYEKYWGFQPEPNYQKEYEKAKKKRSTLDISFLQFQPCDYFTHEIVKEYFIKLGFPYFWLISWQLKL